MNDAQVAMWLTISMVASFFFIAIAFVFVFISGQEMHILQKVGFALLVFGLVVQVVRSVHYLQFGSYPIDKHVPLWLAKDAGIMVLIYFYSFVNPKLRNQNADSSD
jgi:hypothetical protein